MFDVRLVAAIGRSTILGELLDLPGIRSFPGCRTVPPMKLAPDGNEPSMKALAGKERLVVALHVPRTLALPGDAVAVTVPIAVHRIKRAVRVGVYGHEALLRPQAQGDRTEVQVPMADSSPRRQAGQAAGKTRACYVGFDLSK